MSAADVISSFGPAKHWPMGDGENADVVAPDIVNKINDAGNPTSFHSQPAGDPGPASCTDDPITYWNDYPEIVFDYRAPRGAYQPDEGGEFGRRETPELISRAPLPFPLFSGPFTIVYMAGNFRGIKMRDGEGGMAPPNSPSSWAPILSYGSATACVGFESGMTGGWMTIGRQAGLDNLGVGHAVQFGYGMYPEDPSVYDGVDGLSPGTRTIYGTAAAVASVATPNWHSEWAKDLHAFVYDPSHPTKGFMWAAGYAQPLAIVNPACLGNALTTLPAYADPQLMFATSNNPLGWGQRVVVYDEEGEIVMDGDEAVTQMIYPWYSGAGYLHNVAVFDRALTMSDLRNMWQGIYGTPAVYPPVPEPCSPWWGGGVHAEIGIVPLGDNRWRLTGTGSHSEGGTIERLDWLGGTNFLGPMGEDPLGYGGNHIAAGNEIELEVPYPDVYGNQVEIILRVVDNFGAQAYATAYLHPSPPGGPEAPDRLWSIGKVRL